MNRDQFRPVFGDVFDRLCQSADWPSLTVQERGDRLREAMKAEDAKYGRPSRFAAGFDFVHVVRRLL